MSDASLCSIQHRGCPGAQGRVLTQGFQERWPKPPHGSEVLCFAAHSADTVCMGDGFVDLSLPQARSPTRSQTHMEPRTASVKVKKGRDPFAGTIFGGVYIPKAHSGLPQRLLGFL